ncbi:hypothetical protein Bbelb_289620 [Branchiostoma belcheri]|nr:hypothetical protein Bbelb_289620 [Branchiostoma belcheri]
MATLLSDMTDGRRQVVRLASRIVVRRYEQVSDPKVSKKSGPSIRRSFLPVLAERISAECRRGPARGGVSGTISAVGSVLRDKAFTVVCAYFQTNCELDWRKGVFSRTADCLGSVRCEHAYVLFRNHSTRPVICTENTRGDRCGTGDNGLGFFMVVQKPAASEGNTGRFFYTRAALSARMSQSAAFNAAQGSRDAGAGKGATVDLTTPSERVWVQIDNVLAIRPFFVHLSLELFRRSSYRSECGQDSCGMLGARAERALVAQFFTAFMLARSIGDCFTRSIVQKNIV